MYTLCGCEYESEDMFQSLLHKGIANMSSTDLGNYFKYTFQLFKTENLNIYDPKPFTYTYSIGSSVLRKYYEKWMKTHGYLSPENNISTVNFSNICSSHGLLTTRVSSGKIYINVSMKNICNSTKNSDKLDSDEPVYPNVCGTVSTIFNDHYNQSENTDYFNVKSQNFFYNEKKYSSNYNSYIMKHSTAKEIGTVMFNKNVDIVKCRSLFIKMTSKLHTLNENMNENMNVIKNIVLSYNNIDWKWVLPSVAMKFNYDQIDDNIIIVDLSSVPLIFARKMREQCKISLNFVRECECECELLIDEIYLDNLSDTKWMLANNLLIKETVYNTAENILINFSDPKHPQGQIISRGFSGVCSGFYFCSIKPNCIELIEILYGGHPMLQLKGHLLQSIAVNTCGDDNKNMNKNGFYLPLNCKTELSSVHQININISFKEGTDIKSFDMYTESYKYITYVNDYVDIKTILY